MDRRTDKAGCRVAEHATKNKAGYTAIADGWAGAVMRKPLGIQKCDRPTNRPTDITTDKARCNRSHKIRQNEVKTRGKKR